MIHHQNSTRQLGGKLSDTNFTVSKSTVISILYCLLRDTLDLVIRVNTPLKIKYNLEVWKISVQYESTFALNRDLDVKKKLLDSGL